MKYRWVIAHVDPETVTLLMGSDSNPGDYHSAILAQCLANRKVSTPEQAIAFLNPRLGILSDPFLLPDMEIAVDRVLKAINKQEKVTIVGDYDVDGLVATAILSETLGMFGLQAEQFIPRRIEEGYGLTITTAQKCVSMFDPSLIITVDCGSSSAEALTWLRNRAIDVIVIDHHHVATLPTQALALINPHRNTASEDPLKVGQFTELCSGALAFKFCHALIKRARQLNIPRAFEIDLKSFLDLVTLATIADAVPLTGENRIFSKIGLMYLNQSKRPGILALKQVAQTSNKLEAWDVAFLLAPRLNAAGRLNTARDALELLMTRDSHRAHVLAQQLDIQNRQRQEIEKQVFESALLRLKDNFDPQSHYAIVLGDEHWHIGVIGIVAAKILQQFYRPTVIMGGAGSYWRGSARSIPGFHLVKALQKCSHLLVGFGGHSAAAGISINPCNVNQFAQTFNSIATEELSTNQLLPLLELDAEITLRDVTMELAESLIQLRPWGIGNPQPKFLIRRLTHAHPPRRIGSEGRHTKLWVTDGHTCCPVIWWDSNGETLPTGAFDIACTITLNEYEGRTYPQLELIDWRPAVDD